MQISPPITGPSGRAVLDVGLRRLACWDCRFESHRGHGRLSLVCVVSCQVEVSATSWSLVQEPYRLWCVVVCDLETSRMRRPWPTGGLLRQKQTKKQTKHIYIYIYILVPVDSSPVACTTTLLQLEAVSSKIFSYTNSYFYWLRHAWYKQ